MKKFRLEVPFSGTMYGQEIFEIEAETEQQALEKFRNAADEGLEYEQKWLIGRDQQDDDFYSNHDAIRVEAQNGK
jgi:hypothetical protein